MECYWWPVLFFHKRQSNTLMDYWCRIHVRSQRVHLCLKQSNMFFIHSDLHFNPSDGVGNRDPVICHQTSMCRLIQLTANNYQNYLKWREVPGLVPYRVWRKWWITDFPEAPAAHFVLVMEAVDKDTRAASSGLLRHLLLKHPWHLSCPL